MNQYAALKLEEVHAIDQNMGSALQVMEGPVHGVLIAPQAASDADMVSLWHGQLPIRQHPGPLCG